MKIVIIGTGNVGTALAHALHEKGHEVCAIFSREKGRAEELGALVNSEVAGTDYASMPIVDIVVFAVKDDVIRETAKKVFDIRGDEKFVYAHLSGALTSDELSMFENRAAMHPIQTFVGVDDPEEAFSGIYFDVESSNSSTLEIVGDLVTSLGSKVIPLSGDQKTGLHIAAVFACNNLVGLLNETFSLCKDLGIDEKDAYQAFKPLIEQTLRNIEHQGVKDALSGPVKRRDLVTLERHQRYLKKRRPDLLPLYREFVRRLEKMR